MDRVAAARLRVVRVAGVWSASISAAILTVLCARTRAHTRSGLWVPDRRRTLCDLLILVDEAAEAVASFDLVEPGWCAAGKRA